MMDDALGRLAVKRRRFAAANDVFAAALADALEALEQAYSLSNRSWFSVDFADDEGGGWLAH